MSEEVFKSILEKAVMSEYEELDNETDHKFSLRHRLAMKRIFARYERNVRELRANKTATTGKIVENNPRYRLSRQLFYAVIVIIFAAFLVGWVAVYVSEKFNGTVYHDNTQLIAAEKDNSLTVIKYKYALASVPDGFEITDTYSSPMCVYTLYTNKQTQQEITLRQWVKSKFSPHYNTEKHNFEEITINGKSGLYIDFSIGTYCQTMLVWDNDDYIIEIVVDFDKESAINLSKIDKK